MINQGNRRWWVLGALAVGIIAVGLDMTILNLALPVLATDLHATNGDLQWFADAYNLIFAAMLLPAGLLGDRLGRKKMLIIGLIVFGAASAACAYASSSWELIAGRAVLGLGAAFLVPLSMSIIPVLFSEEERPKAIGVWMMANALGIPLGPVVGGWLLNNYWWGSVFLINIPLVIIALIAVSILLPETRSEVKQKVDTIGILASSLGLIGLTYGVIEIGERGWGDVTALSSIIGGILCLAVFMLWEKRVKQPLIDPSLFRSSKFTWGSILATVISFAMFGVLFVTPQYFQAVQGVDALGSGLRLLPLVGGLLFGAPISDKLQSKFGTRATIALGFSILFAGLAVGANTGVDSGYGFASIWVTVVGLGIGFALPAAMDVAMSALSAERSGVGSALIMALRQVGGTMGVAILGTVLSTYYRNNLDLSGLPGDVAEVVQRSVSAGAAVAQKIDSAALLNSVRASFVAGMEMMLWVCGGVAVLGLLLTVIFIQKKTNSNRTLELNQNVIGE
ncbi:drug resistance transporter, EmrB/QacA subfamily [Paenibacillus uliginis N3/975]|uniref:Drug resistance transporter, EmrB/QacA subfamily n=1 Tax=Paenibacillus uliginis N3/975 TaxID=1313296 RepID=A0A1X7G707_9BACL|nr:MFS transporter [Paenibacillus uliginis]SMF64597.1 drug resistance transporter, EmrB/QacA subfamily [Paenibacillus uliginis N3/975]